MSFAALSAYLRPEYPKYASTEHSQGTVYHYRAPTATIEEHVPLIYDEWEDERLVRSIEHTPSLDNSGYDDLIVSTVYNIAETEEIEPVLESERYQIRWVPNDLPLMQHPAFLPDGASDLTLGTPSGREHIFGWELEENTTLKTARKYRKIENGQSVAPDIAIPDDTGAMVYVKLRQLGFDSFTVFLPVWTRVGVYSGTFAPDTGEYSDAPGASAAGIYAATPGAPTGGGYPSGYQWIKSGDSAERIGTKTKWQRTEEWTGFTKVYFDSATLNPASNTLP